MKRFLAAAALACGLVSLACPASATVMKFTVAAGSINDTFTLDDHAGVIDLVSGFLAFHLITDSNGYNGAYFGDSGTGGDIGAGHFISSNLIDEAYDVRVFPAFYSGSGTSIDFVPGVYGLAGGGTITVSGVPEPSSLLMLLAGMAGLGVFALRRRNA